ncbi:TlpA family protein disulfide reductase [Bacteroidales bacterium OttesenSCG-928-L03]|nr:TlpA family protein disulfide reductase [Bacteroidales bacterium OttesenSCG-928-L03]
MDQMKRISLLLLALITLTSVQAKKEIIEPAYEARTSAIENITKIELGKKETRITIRTEFVPKWWVTFSDSAYLEIPETRERLYVTGIEGTEFGKQTYMPASGDSTFVLLFPAIPKKVKTIDYHSGDEASIYGLSLEKKSSKKSRPADVPESISTWIDEQLAQAAIQEPIDLHSDKFFNDTPARLIGYIRGYDSRFNLNSSLIYLSDAVTNEDFPRVVEIHPDGRFEVDLPMQHPIYSYFMFEKMNIYYYIEPGQTLAMILDWEDFLQADKHRNITYYPRNMNFRGPLASVNSDLQLLNSGVKEPDRAFIYNKGRKMEAMALKAELESQYKQYITQLDQFIAENPSLNPKAIELKKIDMQVLLAQKLLDYEMRNAGQVDNFPMEYYDFLHDFPMDNPLLLISNSYKIFLNRFEFSAPFRTNNNTPTRRYKEPTQKTLAEYLKEQGHALSEEERYLCDSIFQVVFESTGISNETIKKIQEKQELLDSFGERNEEHMRKYREEHLIPLGEIKVDNSPLQYYKTRDEVLKNFFKLKPSFTYEVCKVRALPGRLKQQSEEDAHTFMQAFNQQLTHPYLLTRANALFSNTFAKKSQEKYALPEGKGSDVFKQIIDPFKGKVLFIDFWGTFCGPCLHGIKQMKPVRDKYKDHPDFAFIFITSEDDSPQADYDKWVNEQELEHTFRLSKSDYNQLRQLFRFNGIPHYVKVDAEGYILDDDYSIYFVEQDIKKMEEQ